MKDSKKGRLLCCVCLVMLLVPLLGMLVFGPSQARSNERLAPKPRLVRAGHLNAAFLSETADYFAGRFFLRPALITANSAVRAAVFHTSASQDVILGRGGWLFYQDTLADFQGTNQMTEREVFCAARNLALMQEACETSGTQFLFVCAPNKNTVYPEFMPEQYRKTDARSDLDRLEAELAEQGVMFCDLRQTLTGRGALTYYQTDSHWNGYGSALACGEILRALGKAAKAPEALGMQAHAADLYQMLYPASKKTEDAPGPALEGTFSYLGEVRGPDDQFIRTQSGADGTLFMFRDSFGNALHADLAGAFESAAFSRAMPYDFSQPEKTPDVLIAEIAQRNLRWLSQRPPMLPAPERAAADWTAAAEETLFVQVSQSGFDGLARYEGTFPKAPADDACVYACIDGTWYEACLTADGFSLFAPEGERVQIVTNMDDAAAAFDAELITK